MFLRPVENRELTDLPRPSHWTGRGKGGQKEGIKCWDSIQERGEHQGRSQKFVFLGV